MKVLFLLGFVFSCLSGLGQVKVVLEQHSDTHFLKFIPAEASPFWDALQVEFGYEAMRRAIVSEAPNSHETKGLASGEIEQVIAETDESLAELQLEIELDRSGFLVIGKTVWPEGGQKATNSLHGEWPYEFPTVIDVVGQQVIWQLETLLSVEGMQAVQLLARRTFSYRAGDFCASDSESDCRIGNRGICDLLAEEISISNRPEDNDIFSSGDLNFAFSFSATGLELHCNHLDHQTLLCEDPGADLSIPWIELYPFIRDAYLARIQELTESQYRWVAGNRSLVVDKAFVNLMPIPDREGEEAKKVKPYVVKGDRLEAVCEWGEFAKVKYQGREGKVYEGWVRLKDCLVSK